MCTHLSNHILLSQLFLGKAEPGKQNSAEIMIRYTIAMVSLTFLLGNITAMIMMKRLKGKRDVLENEKLKMKNLKWLQV